jgi:hypothetical protein
MGFTTYGMGEHWNVAAVDRMSVRRVNLARLQAQAAHSGQSLDAHSRGLNDHTRLQSCR